MAFIKCDVEGHEHEVLMGAVNVLRHSKPVLLIEVEQRHRKRAVGDTLSFCAAWATTDTCWRRMGRGW